MDVGTITEVDHTKNLDIAVIGSGPAGLCAAIAAKEKGAENVAVFERLPYLGGILRQCDHTGFGAFRYKEELSGIEYSQRLINEATSAGVMLFTDSFVSELSPGGIKIVKSKEEFIKTKAIILATGCRERTIGNINANILSICSALPSSDANHLKNLDHVSPKYPTDSAFPPLITGTRPSGVFTAGTAQRMINIGNMKVGKRAVVLGSGDIGLIVARRMIQSGTEVSMILEKEAACSALNKNIIGCIEKYKIPFHTRTTVTEIHGNTRLEAVSISGLSQDGSMIPGTEKRIECDTLIISVGLIPELELCSDYRKKHGSVPDNIFTCGNAREILKMADDIANDGFAAGIEAVAYISPSS